MEGSTSYMGTYGSSESEALPDFRRGFGLMDVSCPSEFVLILRPIDSCGGFNDRPFGVPVKSKPQEDISNHGLQAILLSGNLKFTITCSVFRQLKISIFTLVCVLENE